MRRKISVVEMPCVYLQRVRERITTAAYGIVRKMPISIGAE